VVGEDGREVPRDGQTVGEIVVRGNVVMKGYYEDPEATAHAMRDGWFHTGDAAVVHPDGYAEIRDRYQALLRTSTDVELTPIAEAYVARVNGDYREAVPDYLVQQMPPALRTALFASGGGGDFGLLAQQMVTVSPTRERRTLPPMRLLFRSPRTARKYLAEYVKDQYYRRRRALRQRRKSARRVAKIARHRAATSLSGRGIGRGVQRAARVPRRMAAAVRRFYRRHLKIAVRAFTLGDMSRPLKEPGTPMETSFRGRWGGARLQYLRLLGGARKQTLLREYHDRCAAPDFTAPYVFVALHYQPEQTTSPTGGVFVDQQIMVDMLARLVPPGWFVYVKEHPFQFFPTSIGERSRAVEFYDDLVCHENVRLVPWSVSPFRLIDHARAVATVTGTTGIEAVVRGKPVLVFGHAWYGGCEGVFYTPDVSRCAAALARIEGGYVVDRRKVRLFLKAVEQSCFRADMDFGVIIDPPISHADNVARLSGGIRRVLQRHRRRAPITASLPV